MQRLPLWVAVVPTHELVRLLVTEPSVGTVLKGRLPVPQEPRSLVLLLEALSAWSGRPIRAALDADAEAVRADPPRPQGPPFLEQVETNAGLKEHWKDTICYRTMLQRALLLRDLGPRDEFRAVLFALPAGLKEGVPLWNAADRIRNSLEERLEPPP